MAKKIQHPAMRPEVAAAIVAVATTLDANDVRPEVGASACLTVFGMLLLQLDLSNDQVREMARTWLNDSWLDLARVELAANSEAENNG